MIVPAGHSGSDPAALPLVGREREQAVLRERLDAALGRRGALVLIGAIIMMLQINVLLTLVTMAVTPVFVLIIRGFRRKRWRDHDDHRSRTDKAHRYEVLHRVVGELIDERIDRDLGGTRERDRVAVGRRLHCNLRADGPAAARAILDDYLLPEPLA